MRHDACPSTMTIDSLADWIRSNKVDVVNHTEKIKLTEEEQVELQKQSSLASRAIDKLKDTLKYITELIQNGTPWDSSTNAHRPVSPTIPRTQGIKILEKNRKFADDQLEKGYKEEITPIYMIPWPEHEKMVAMDIMGEEWTKYSRGMSPDEIMQHGKPILRSAAHKFREDLAASGMRIEGTDDDGSTVISTGHEKKKKRSLLDDEDLPI